VEISQERLEKFWKRWGLSSYPECCCISGRKGPCWGTSAETYGKNGNWHFVMPNLTLDNLFKYAVRTAKAEHIVFHFYSKSIGVNIYNQNDDCELAEADTPALALFLALEKLTQ
jgi:hypothetical protein